MTIVSVRKETTNALKRAASFYLVKRKYGVNSEIGLLRWGKYKADLLAVSLYGHVVIVEIKSCLQDYRTDKKHLEYLKYCNQMYICVTKSTYEKIKTHVDPEVGLLVLNSTVGSKNYGYVEVKRRASNRDIDRKTVDSLILRMAWRNAEFNKRNTPRRQRVVLKA